MTFIISFTASEVVAVDQLSTNSGRTLEPTIVTPR